MTWTTDDEGEPYQPMSDAEVKRRREAFDDERARRWRQAQSSEDSPTYNPWTGYYD